MKHKMKYSLVGLGLLATVGLSLASTDVHAQEDDNRGDLVMAMMSDVVTLDPHDSNDASSGQVRINIYERLIHTDVDMNLEPGLATEWEAIDETTWNFTLREGTTFHSGAEFTGEDVKATFDRVLDPAVGSVVSFLYEMIEEVEVVDDYEVNLHLEYPFAPLISHLAHNTAGIMSKDLIDRDYQNAIDEAGLDITLDEYYELREEGGEEFEEVAAEMGEFLGQIIAAEPDGTNHLKFASRSAGSEVVFDLFEDFQGGERNFDSVTFRVIPESGSRMAELETGGIDIVKELDATNYERVVNNEATDVVEAESLRTEYLGMNTQNEPFDDQNVRLAIAHAIDRDMIVEGVLNGIGNVANGPLASGVFGYDEEVSTQVYDVELAREYLAESSVPDGFDTTIWVRNEEQYVNIALYIQESLAEIGINAEIEQMEWGAYLDRLANGEHDMYILGWTTVTADADYGLYVLNHSETYGAAGNRAFFSTPELDELLDAGRSNPDPDERLDIYRDAQEIIVEESPVVYLMHQNFIAGYNTDNITGITITPVGDVRFEDVEFVNE
ncbi:glutathione ABC transporter substrate-binding protein [Aliicoccus persicus]|uniref:Glutathione ABC transporter substrate-binding protein n=1 Tax=Aliicoccus persicus TaxID=930138 RepID=A0A662Z5F2_9STAP|nr:glutathione ABC transporter substrate-binding protein [Aliicoccus persicus]SEW19026.1 peptide/nickel transport system substrate-binding protein [Aliicoccus persicus]HJE19175.1 glutathione ABC transporter substrate-binding protein [Aliicoccus persicus]